MEKFNFFKEEEQQKNYGGNGKPKESNGCGRQIKIFDEKTTKSPDNAGNYCFEVRV